MKNQKYIWLAVVFVVIAAWLFFYKPVVNTPARQDAATNMAATNPTAQIAVSNSIPRQPPVAPVAASANPASYPPDIVAKYRQGQISKGQAMQEILMDQNKKSLDIYGKVIDQYGQPVAGAEVEGSILLNVSFVSSGGENHVTETDSQGGFNFLGVHGVSMGIRPQKEGYFYNLKMPSQRPENYQPDPNNPVIFTMWKIQGAEQLVSSGFESVIPSDGIPTTFDIATQKKSDEGDLRVTLSRAPLQVRRGGQLFDWDMKIEMLHGGLLPENDPYPYLAPDDGYESSFEFGMSSNNVPWHSRLTQDFYVRSSNGQYGLMHIDLHAALTPAKIKFNFTVNPSGSKNLDPDFSNQ